MILGKNRLINEKRKKKRKEKKEERFFPSPPSSMESMDFRGAALKALEPPDKSDIRWLLAHFPTLSVKDEDLVAGVKKSKISPLGIRAHPRGSIIAFRSEKDAATAMGNPPRWPTEPSPSPLSQKLRCPPEARKKTEDFRDPILALSQPNHRSSQGCQLHRLSPQAGDRQGPPYHQDPARHLLGDKRS